MTALARDRGRAIRLVQTHPNTADHWQELARVVLRSGRPYPGPTLPWISGMRCVGPGPVRSWLLENLLRELDVTRSGRTSPLGRAWGTRGRSVWGLPLAICRESDGALLRLIACDGYGPPFYLDRTPVTRRAAQTLRKRRASFRGRTPAATRASPSAPVVDASREWILDYARATRSRLPTAEEWRRAYGDRRFPWGDDEPQARHAHWDSEGVLSLSPSPWFQGLARDTYLRNGPGPVDGHPDGAGPHGHLGLVGGVREHVLDRVHVGDRVGGVGSSYLSRTWELDRKDVQQVPTLGDPATGFRLVLELTPFLALDRDPEAAWKGHRSLLEILRGKH